MKGTEQVIFTGLIREVRGLFHLFAAVSDELHADLGIPAGQRAVMESLSQPGGKTVPQLADMRSVSRQHIQVIVNQLLDKGLVELVDNPAHRRSSLVRLTEHGRETFGQMRQRERQVLASLELAISEDDLETALHTLTAIKDVLAGENWRPQPL